MLGKTTSKKDDLPENQQAGQSALGNSADNQQSGQEAQGKGPQAVTRAAIAAAFNRMRERANHGDRNARVALIKHLDSNPEGWAMLGDMAGYAETALVEAITHGEWLTTQAIKRRAAELRRQLSRPSQSPLEDLAVQRLVACWVQLQFVESMCSRADGKLEGAKLWLQRQQQAHKLYAAAEKSLLLIRGLVSPAVYPAAAAKVDISTSISGANGAEPKEKSSEPAETPSCAFSEGPSAGFTGVNRIAHLTDNLNRGSGSAGADTADGKRRINGHDQGGRITCVGP
jgi:hypothetical protein